MKHTLEKKQPTSESILGLSVLRRQNANDKDIAKAVVRIGVSSTTGKTQACLKLHSHSSFFIIVSQTPDDVPIEENYDGVLTGQTLGSGAFGTVRRVTHRTTGLQYAVKCIDLVSSQNHKDHEKMEMSLLQLRNEIAIMCQLDHPNIVRIEEVYFTDQTVYIVQELCTGGDPFDRLSALNISRFSEAQAATMVKEMLSAIR